MRKKVKSKKESALDARVEMIGLLNDEYRNLTDCCHPNPTSLRALAARFREGGMPGRAERICMEAFILEREQSRKSVLNSGIIVPVGTTNLAIGGTDEIPASIDIGIAVSIVSDSVCAGG